MDISFVPAPGRKPGTLVVGVSDGGTMTPFVNGLDKASGGALSKAIAKSGFKGGTGKLLELLAPANVDAERILLAGLGKPGELGSPAAENLGAAVVRTLLTGGETTVTIMLDLAEISARNAKKKTKDRATAADLAAHVALGAYLRSYRFDHYRTSLKDDQPTLKSVRIVVKAKAEAERAWRELSAVGEGIALARDLVNEPANVLYPEEVAKRLKGLSKLGVKVEVLGEQDMRRLGMNMLLAVGQGSDHESRLVVMRWNGAGNGKNAKDGPLAFVGKGVCFDSGGLSLKTPTTMVGMKGDMGGAAAVAGLMYTLARRKARVNAVGVIGLVENMPDGSAMRPNDIVKTMSGQTVEVLNTDAEGRLVLADALWYTKQRFKPRFMINLATLTGAIIVSLGHEYAGLFSNDDELSSRILAAGEKEDEQAWRLPMAEAYDRQLKSKISDMKNIGGHSAGSITAAHFLKRFVEKVPWAHLDIAGVAWQDGEQKAKIPSWGTGWGVRLLNRLIADNYEG